MKLTPDVLRAFHASVYEVEGLVQPLSIRIGESNPDLDAYLTTVEADTAGIITAYNPFSDLHPLEDNRAAQLRLAADLRQFTLVPCVGRSQPGEPHWQEESFLALRIDVATLLRAADTYGQHAAVWIERGKQPELILTPMA